MDQNIRAALGRGGVIDMTTQGRRSGESRRIEIVFHTFDGKIYIEWPGPRRSRKRSWIYNLEADPKLTIHLKGAVAADRFRATPGSSPTRRSGDEIIRKIIDTSYRHSTPTSRRWSATARSSEVSARLGRGLTEARGSDRPNGIEPRHQPPPVALPASPLGAQ